VSATAPLQPSAVHPGDLFRIATVGLRSRRLRATLSALGIAIGIAAMVAVLGISESSRTELLSSLDRLGTNLLTIQAGQGFGLGSGEGLPTTAEAMLGRIEPVQGVSSVTVVEATVRRTDLVPPTRTGGITVQATDPALLDTLRAEVAQGEWLDGTRTGLPVVVLGSVAAERLGLTEVSDNPMVWIGDRWFSVVGILEPVELAPDLDRAALIGEQIAEKEFGTTSSPGTIYLRTDPEVIDDVRTVVPATVNPAEPDTVEVSRPSDALEAKAAASSAFTSLFLGLGAVALLVGGVGIANVMVIAVLERRSEIGLRRALGATRRHVSAQFLTEALLLSGTGGVLGAVLGAAVTAGYSLLRGWDIRVPVFGVLGAVVSSLLIGALAGLYPARRAAGLSPTDALRPV
jgi:putative ABC transport system permease protein